MDIRTTEEYRLPQFRDFLDRFRPAGAPGAAHRAAVPADRAAQLEAELMPLLMLLDDAAASCARTVAQAQAEAQRILAAARAEAAARLEDASRQASAVRAETVRQVATATRAEADGAVAAAHVQADEIGRLSRRRIPALAARAVGLVQALGEEGTGSAGGSAGRRDKPGSPA